MNVFEWIKSVAVTNWNSLVQTWPEDKDERRRMQALMLGAGSGGRCSSKIEIETSDSDEKPDEQV